MYIIDDLGLGLYIEFNNLELLVDDELHKDLMVEFHSTVVDSALMLDEYPIFLNSALILELI